MAIIGNKTDL
jgi:GTPase SAR1 family protein